MAKKYYQSVRSRMGESRGMERYETEKKMRLAERDRYVTKVKVGRSDEAEVRKLIRGYETMYETMKTNEFVDGDMLQGDSRAPANMPQECMIKMYPGLWHGYEAELIDTFQGVDYQVEEDVRDQKHGKWPRKY